MTALRAELGDVAIFSAMRRYGNAGMHVVLDVRRAYAQADLERAMRATIEAFPVLGCRYQTGLWRDRWVPVDRPLADAVCVEDVGDPGELEARTAAWVARGLDGCRDRPIRVVALAHAGGTRVLLTLLHLVVDGAGVAAVGHVFSAHLHGLPLRARVEPRRSPTSTLEGLRWFHLPVLLRDLGRVFVQPIRQARAPRRERSYVGAGPAGVPSWREIRLDAATVQATRARLGGGTVNDLLVATFARVAGSRSRGGPAVVLFSMDLRRFAGEPRLVAANSSSIMSAVVPREALGSLREAVASVRTITERDVRGLVGPAFLLGPALLTAGTPHALLRPLVHWAAPHIFDMPLQRGLLMTNVGRVDEGVEAFGDELDAVRIIGPWVDDLVAPIVVAYGFRGAVHLSIFAPPNLGADTLDELEAEIRAALELG